MNIEKTVNHGGHGEHGEKTRGYFNYSNHPLSESGAKSKSRIFAVPAVFAVVELRFLR
jgi:hypothetical protein